MKISYLTLFLFINLTFHIYVSVDQDLPSHLSKDKPIYKSNLFVQIYALVYPLPFPVIWSFRRAISYLLLNMSFVSLSVMVKGGRQKDHVLPLSAISNALKLRNVCIFMLPFIGSEEYKPRIECFTSFEDPLYWCSRYVATNGFFLYVTVTELQTDILVELFVYWWFQQYNFLASSFLCLWSDLDRTELNCSPLSLLYIPELWI